MCSPQIQFKKRIDKHCLSNAKLTFMQCFQEVVISTLTTVTESLCHTFTTLYGLITVLFIFQILFQLCSQDYTCVYTPFIQSFRHTVSRDQARSNLQQMKLQFRHEYLGTDFHICLYMLLSKDIRQTKPLQVDMLVKIGILSLLSCFVKEIVCQVCHCVPR